MKSFKPIVAGTIAFLAVAAAASAAQADVKIVTFVTYSNNSKGPVPVAVPVTAFYKGKLARLESAGSVVITDYAANKIYTLDPAKKTYYVMSSSKMALGAMADNPMLSLLRIKPTVYFHPGGQTQMIAGKTAQNYKYQATFTFSLGDGAGAPPGASAMLPTVVLSGEIWATEQIKDADAHKNANFPIADNLPPFLATGIKALTSKLAEVKGMTLSSTQTVKISAPPGSPLAASLPAEPTVTRSKVMSVSEEPLADALFTTEGYTEVPAPTTPPVGVGGQPLGGGDV